MTRKYNILAFQNCFSYFHWNIERESRRLWTLSFSSDRFFFLEQAWQLRDDEGRFYYPWDALVRGISLVYLNDRAVQTKCSETCNISSKSWELQLFRNVLLVLNKISNENLQEVKNNTFDQNVKLIDWNSRNMTWFYHSTGDSKQLFRNESYMTRKFNILAFQNCFSYFHWNVERESKRL